VTTATHVPARIERERARLGPGQLLRRAPSMVLTLAVLAVALATSVIAISSRLSSRGEYSIFGHPVLVVLSGSMTPTFDTGDLVIDSQVTPAQAGHLHVGQIITFHEGTGANRVLTHRIVAVRTTLDGAVAYQTKGDANNAPDADLRPAAAVVGVYTGRIPRGGFMLANLHRPLVAGLLLASPLLWLVGAPLRRWGREENGGEISSTTEMYGQDKE
jgi:signal peptidase